ncbi:uncharacterized protein FMAN_11014 [Fusarium mangiferae]|uniref:C2H2-type domain-containing protein n=1 Tax=Fusarium mangiferae TaxID=192010 RepID=A0A1L7TDK5_FUSMA|nr:uncharacterized protein FMAN_11014 [Fusarium mangiferae]CVK96684.1 uncharacterized protein FMAN_11014 [Fusarium mangiferae]
MPLFALDQPHQLVASFGSSMNGKGSESPALVPSATYDTPQISVTSSITSDNNLICRWKACNQKSITTELLYEHICERHVGRKSSNNLNLTCQWGSCRTSTIKRHHIISHVLTHVALRPHKCRFCSKTFKRPQDLKKHTKRHADDSIWHQTRQDSGLQLPSDISQLGFPLQPRRSAFLSLKGDSTVDLTGYWGGDSRMQTNAPTSRRPTGHPSGYHASQSSIRHGAYSAQRSLNYSRSGNTSYSAVSGSSNRKCTFKAVGTKHPEISTSSYAHIDYSMMFPSSSLAIRNNSMVTNEQHMPQPASLVMVYGCPAASQNPPAH